LILINTKLHGGFVGAVGGPRFADLMPVESVSKVSVRRRRDHNAVATNQFRARHLQVSETKWPVQPNILARGVALRGNLGAGVGVGVDVCVGLAFSLSDGVAVTVAVGVGVGLGVSVV
jgi:hypothetical protein